MPRQISLSQIVSDLDYYCKNLLVIKPKEAGLSLFNFNSAQKYLYYGIPDDLKKNDRRFAHTILDRGWKQCDEQGIPLRQYILKARQMGVSTLCESRLFQKAHTRPGTNCLVVAQDDEATTGIFFMARTFYAYLPQVLRPQIRKSSARELLFQNPNGIGGLNSWLKTQTAGWKNIGRSKTLHHLHCCLSGETLIETALGYAKRIDEIEVGDEVRTHGGVWAEVSAVSKRPAEEVSEGGITLKLQPWLSNEPLHVTPDHKLWSVEGWKAARDFKVGDEIAYPLKSITRELSTLEVFADSRPRPQGGGSLPKSGIIALNKEFGFFVGYYLAEGSLQKNVTTQGLSASAVVFSHHQNEHAFAERAVASVAHLISSSRRAENKGSLTSHDILYSGALAQTIQREFGEGDEKRIPDWVFQTGADFLTGIWEGYCAGDGSKAAPERFITITSIRRQLLIQLRYITAALDLGWPGIHKKHEGFVDPRGWQCKAAWTLGWSAGNSKPHIRKWRREGNTIWVKIKSIEEAETDFVYDLEINHPDHSFVTAAGAVKNSEVSFWPDAEAVVDGLFQAVPRQPDTSILIETTAQGLGTWAYNAWLTAKEARNAGQSAGFDPVFIPWYILPEYASPVPKDYEFEQVDTDFKDEYGLTWEQIYWYKSTLSIFELGHPGRGLQFMQTEYPSNDFEPWKAAGQSAFPTDTIELIFRYQVRAPEKRFGVFADKFIEDSNGALRIWERPVAGMQYAIGVDTAHGVGQDYSVVSVLAHPGCRQVAEWSSNEMGPKQLATVIEAIARWYNEAVVAVEVDGATGLLVNSTLNESYSNLYRWEYFDKQKNAETQKLGWQTTERTKSLLIDHANSLYSPEIKAVIRSENIAEEMRLLRMSPFSGSGLAQYAFLNHTGDHLMAWLIACMCLWRKIARYDAGNDDLQTYQVEKIRDPSLYDTKADAIFNGTTLPEEFFGNRPYSENSWLSY